MRVHPLAPVLGLDIDGTIADYHTHFVEFLNRVYFTHEKKTFGAWNQSPTGEFSEMLNLPKDEYRAAKLAYRLGGFKRCLPLFGNDFDKNGPDAVRIEIQYLRSQGIQVWVCTQRPWQALTTVDVDTQYWIQHVVGEIDGLIYGEDKYADLVDIVGRQRVLGVADDLPECIHRAQDLGLRTAMRRGPHNNNWIREHPANRVEVFTRIKDLSNIVDEWKNRHRG